MPKQPKQTTQSPEKQTPEYANVIKNKGKVLKQYQKEKDFAVKLRQTKINQWIRTEEQYNGVVQKTLLTRSNLHSPVVFEGIWNMSAKLGMNPDVKYDTVPEGDENASHIMKHVVMEDLEDSSWEDMYDQSKIEAGIYGRTIYKVIPGNDKNTVELVDTLAYLISPLAKNTKDALYQGQQFIYKTIEELYEEAEEMEYDMESLKMLKENEIPQDTQTTNSSEESAKNLRMAQMGLANTTQYGSDVANLTEWWTYLSNKKKTESVLYRVVVANDLYVLSCEPASNFGLKRPPFISWGTYQRGITFWCMSVGDIYRDPNMAVDVNVNQMIDNNTYRNFAMSFVASDSGLKQSSIVPRPLGITPVTVGPGQSIKDKIYTPEVPEISSAVETMQVIKGFADSASGLNNPPAQSKGGKTSVTKQAQLNAEIDQKVATMKRNATNACQELYQLMADITSEKLTKPRKVKIFGFNNLTIEDVTRKNFQGVKLVAKASPAESSVANKAIKQKAKMDLYEIFKDDPKVPGQLALRRSVAKTFDIDPDELQSWFTAEEQPSTQGTDSSAAPVAPAAPAAPANGAAPTDATALLSATQKEAQSNVAPAIKP